MFTISFMNFARYIFEHMNLLVVRLCVCGRCDGVSVLRLEDTDEDTKNTVRHNYATILGRKKHNGKAKTANPSR